MTIKERFNTQRGTPLVVEKRILPFGMEISLRLEELRECLLHWGVREELQGPWQIPPKAVWPQDSRAFDHNAVQTPFLKRDGHEEITIKFDMMPSFALMDFVLYFPGENLWDNNSGRNYRILLSGLPTEAQTKAPAISPAEMLKAEAGPGEVSFEHIFQIANSLELAAGVFQDQQRYHVALVTNIPGPLIIHWGIATRFKHEWMIPPASILPAGTTVFQNRAAQTQFEEVKGFRQFHIDVEGENAPMGLAFVLKDVANDRWIKDAGRDFYVPVSGSQQPVISFDNPVLCAIADKIVENEMSRNSWTLMHRFNLCHDLLNKAADTRDGLALLFVWLRYSSLRQLDWQRNYNTKPRELGHSMDRLTLKLAELYADKRETRELVRLILTTLGRGTDAQRVRDEILHIMHRHHIKEVSGHFMEEWHQKLHNNTTPDDVVICEAMLDFLRSDGDLAKFYHRLNQGGVTKERLASYERPIKSDPNFLPHLKDALIRDFEYFLQILSEVHRGTDVVAAIKAASSHVDQQMHEILNYILEHRNEQKVSAPSLIDKITESRRRLSKHLRERRDGLRDLLFLDLALEDFLRVIVERSISPDINGEDLARMTGMILENLCFANGDEEFDLGFQHWQRLLNQEHFSREWSLQAKAVVDRMARALGAFVDRYTNLLQLKAELLGTAFHAAPWTINLFSEEVVRARIEFVLSMILQRMDRLLRSRAKLGNWQVISPGATSGRVETLPSLRSIQGKHFPEATVIVADKVFGDEEIPQGVTSIITIDTTDIVSHLAIRARNAGVLFATCFEPADMVRLKSLEGKEIEIFVNKGNEVEFEETMNPSKHAPPRSIFQRARILPPTFSAFVISETDFNERVVGGKSNNLKKLRDKLPKWVRRPTSIAVPFGVFEEALAFGKNKKTAEQYRELSNKIVTVSEENRGQRLAELRKTVLELLAPEGLLASLKVVSAKAGLKSSIAMDDAWLNIKRVWASKWNDRAFLSRDANNIPHDTLSIAVLIQELVEADYSFVVHTVNPFTGDKGEIYAEVVLGLGETLVGNYPGRALSFTSKKGEHEPRIISFPSKSVALYGGGLIFRSDSNGEDLAGYAGAGLYDSFLQPAAEKQQLNYANELLLWNEHFRENLLVTITLIGSMVEKAMGSPQDIEGAYSKGQYHVVQTRPQVGVE